MNRFVLVISRIFLIGLVSIIVLTAVFVGLGRQFIDHLNEVKPQVQTYLSDATGLIIEFDTIAGRWKKLSPQVQIKKLNVKANADQPAFISVKKFKLEVDLGASLLSFRPVIKLWVDGLGVDLGYENGQFALVNGPKPGEQQAERESLLLDTLEMLLKQPRILISDSSIAVQGFWANEVMISNINLSMARQGVRKRLWANLTLENETPINAVVIGDLVGSFTDPDSVSGHLYTRVNAPNLAPWLPLPVAELTALEIQKASGEIGIWGKVENGNLKRITSELHINDVVVTQEGKAYQPPKLTKITATAKWEGDWQNNWVVGFDSLDVEGESFSWSPNHVVIHSKRVSDNQRKYLARLDRGNLAPWVRYYTSFLDQQSSGFKTLTTVKPDAELENLLLEVDVVDKAVVDYKAVAELKNITTFPENWIPGVNNLSAHVLLGKHISIIDFEGKNVDVNYPRLLRSPLLVDEIKGALSIQNTLEEWRIESGLLEVNDQQLNAATQLAILKDKQNNQSPYLRLQATLGKIDSSFIPEHLPVGVIPEGVVGWLDEAIQSGELLRGDLLFHGPTDLTEFEPFQYVLGFTVDNVQLQYLDGWAPVAGAVADVRIYNGEVDAWALQGQYYGAELQQAWVGTKLVAEGAVDLMVDADLKGPIDEAVQILVDSPIKEKTAAVFDTIAVKGDGDINVRVKVPFRGEQTPDVGVAVTVDVNNGQFDLLDQQLTVSELKGRVNFDLQSGLSSPGLQGKAFSGPISATIKTIPDGEHQQTIVMANGSAPLSQIKPWLQLDLLEPLAGDLNYNLDVYLKDESLSKPISRSFVEVYSDLKGISVNYPPPFNKSASETKNFKYKTSIGGEKQYQLIQYNNLFELQMVSVDGAIERGTIAFGQPSLLPDKSQFTISGQLNTLDLSAWQGAIKRIESARQSLGQPERSSGLLQILGPSQIKLEKLVLNGQEISNVQLELNDNASFLNLKAESDQLKGTMLLPKQYVAETDYRQLNDPIIVNIQKLVLEPALVEGAEKNSPQNGNTSFNPGIIPRLDIKVDSLQMGDDDFGLWRAELQPVANGVAINQLEFMFKHVKFKGSGSWLWHGDHSETIIQGKAEAGNVADVLKAWGYAPSLTSKEASMDIKANWPSAPYDFDLLTATADWKLLVKDGRFRDVSSGAADKVLGILNFDDWLKRMRLKIKDLDSSEMPYSEIRGDFDLKNKILKTESLKLDGAALKMAVTGDLNLESKTINGNLDVTIPVTRNLVIPAAAVGGLPAAATVYVIEKVLGSQLDKLTTMKYTIQGPLDDPKVALKESFNIIPKQIQESIVNNGKSPEQSEGSTPDVSNTAVPQHKNTAPPENTDSKDELNTPAM